ncbi:uncharacterized protein [Coffea arabica]|uniref:Uncharacterized protein isoform X3 n=1 Tax=Coffea arabica TaxID=13443 RepID=A0ABM4VWI4_COFAR
MEVAQLQKRFLELISTVYQERFFLFHLIWRYSFDCLGEKRGFWMISSYSFRNCKMRATRILWLKWCPSSLRILRSFSTMWRLPFNNQLWILSRSMLMSTNSRVAVLAGATNSGSWWHDTRNSISISI